MAKTLASDQGETTVEKEKVEMMKQTQTKEEDAPVYVLPRDIDRLCPSIGEEAYGDASAMDYDDYSADYYDPAWHYRQIDEERRLDREAQERDWAARDNNIKEER